MKRIVLGENSRVLPNLPASFARLCYIDPPFNTGKVQKRTRMRVSATRGRGKRTGFGGRRYEVQQVRSATFEDRQDDYCSFLLPRIELALRCLTSDASLFVHLDAREVHYVKVALDRLLGRDHFMNEIVWAYDYGARSRTRWPAKHDSILWYALDPQHYVFRYDAIDRIPYLAPKLVTPEKAARGKTPTDVWWQTIVPTSGKEKNGYPTQKPLAILERIVKVHSEPDDVVLDFFAGSGTTGEAAAKHGRGFVLVDEIPEALRIAAERLARFEPELVGFTREAVSSSATPIDAWMREFLVWISARPRTYSETMEAWQTSCPRHSVWEDALLDGLVELRSAGTATPPMVEVTPRGRALLEASTPATGSGRG